MSKRRKKIRLRPFGNEGYRSVVVSSPDALLHVERLELSEKTRRSLTTGITWIEEPAIAPRSISEEEVSEEKDSSALPSPMLTSTQTGQE